MDSDYLWGERCEMLLRAHSNRLYQQERQWIFEFREGLVKVASLAAGSVAIAKVTNQELVQYSVAAIFIGTAASLIFGWGNKARDAAKRSTEWARLERDIAAAGARHFTEAQLAEWAAKCGEIENGEPAAHPGLRERTYLRACESLGHKPNKPASRLTRWRPAIIVP